MDFMSVLALVTPAASFVAMAVSLWLGCYVVTRSPRSRLAWLAGLTLWSLAGVFIDLFVSINPSPGTPAWRGWPLAVTLTFWYHLSLETLPLSAGRWQRRLLFFVYALAILVDFSLVGVPWLVASGVSGLGIFTAVVSDRLYRLQPAFLLGLALLTLRNLWQARQATTNLAYRKQLDSLVRGTFLSVFAAGYWLTLVTLDLATVVLPIVVALGLGVTILGYGIVRYSALIEGRILRYDFALSGLLTLSLSALYLAAVWLVLRDSLSSGLAVVVVGLAVVTHSSFEFARRVLDWPFMRRAERALRASLRGAALDVTERKAMDDALRGALAAIVVGVNARWGAIALREGEDYVVRASFHWKHIGERLPADMVNVRELTTPPPAASDRPVAVIAPLASENESFGAIQLGQPRGGSAYSEFDLDLIAEAADGISDLARHARGQEARAREIGDMLDAFRTRERELQQRIEALQSAPRSESVSSAHVAAVEDALRRLYDYSYLGEHALALGILARHPAATHLDRGKALNAALVSAVEKLRPNAAEPGELPPREWHPYLILRDAYLHGHSNRDIMSHLYVSEATFHRTRRGALRAVAKALVEMESPANLPS